MAIRNVNMLLPAVAICYSFFILNLMILFVFPSLCFAFQLPDFHQVKEISHLSISFIDLRIPLQESQTAWVRELANSLEKMEQDESFHLTYKKIIAIYSWLSQKQEKLTPYVASAFLATYALTLQYQLLLKAHLTTHSCTLNLLMKKLDKLLLKKRDSYRSLIHKKENTDPLFLWIEHRRTQYFIKEMIESLQGQIAYENDH